MSGVSIILADRRFSIDKNSLAALSERVLRAEGAIGRSLNIIYCSDHHMRHLNRRFKNEDRTTDVLAFDLEEEPGRRFMGEVYVNLQQAKKQAAAHNISFTQEVERLTVHGVLHLLGFDDHSRKDRELMWSRQEGYL